MTLSDKSQCRSTSGGGSDCEADQPCHPTAQSVAFLYTNWRGVTRWRHVVPKSIQFGRLEDACPILRVELKGGHTGSQWLLWADDLEKGAVRTFALRGILQWGQTPPLATAPAGPAAVLARYHNEPRFHDLVGYLVEVVWSGSFTVDDLLAAVSLAADLAENRRRDEER
jgi:hypothetical protein